jgi:hypothetical protein
MIWMHVSWASGGVDPRRADRRDQPGGSRFRSPCCWALGLLLMLGLVAGRVDATDDPVSDQSEPPVRLQKKVKPQPSPAPSQPAKPAPKEEKSKKTEPPPKAEQPEEEPELTPQELEERIREITNRIAKNMNQAEKRLQKSDPGEATQQTQRDIVHDLDELIEQSRRQQQQPPSGGASSSSSSNSSRRQQSRTSARRPSPAPQPQAPNQNGNNPRGGKTSSDGMSKIADLYKDVWGHLPETLRQEMDQYSREQFMSKYGDLLKQYYATIAEKGRRKAEP